MCRNARRTREAFQLGKERGGGLRMRLLLSEVR